MMYFTTEGFKPLRLVRAQGFMKSAITSERKFER